MCARCTIRAIFHRSELRQEKWVGAYKNSLLLFAYPWVNFFYSSTSLIYVASGRLIVLRCLQLKTLAVSCLRPKVLSQFMVLGGVGSTWPPRLRFKICLGYTSVHILSFETSATARTHLFKTSIVINCGNFFFCISKMSVKIFEGKKKNKLLKWLSSVSYFGLANHPIPCVSQVFYRVSRAAECFGVEPGTWRQFERETVVSLAKCPNDGERWGAALVACKIEPETAREKSIEFRGFALKSLHC